MLNTIHDDWTLSKNGNYLIRNHCIPQNTLFDPSEDGNCPIPLPMRHKSRTTRFADGQSQQDRWRCRSNHLDEQIYWTGRTSFKIQPRDRVRAHEHFNNTSEGHQTCAGSPQQRKKDSKNLSERTMSLADQSFIEAKRKELASFFQNQVWEFSDESEAPAQRILRAHFILK